MIEFAALPGPVQATVLVCAVFVQAVILYAGYGVLERIAQPLIKTLTDG